MYTNLLKILPALVAAAILGLSPAAQAQVVSQFNLPDQPLADSLRAVASQTNTNVLFDPPLVAAYRAPALNARLSADEALKRLLVGTGLKHRFVNEHTVVLAAERAVESAPPAQKGATNDADNSTQLQLAQTETRAKASDRPASTEEREAARKDKAAEAVATEGEVTVTGSRIRGLLGEQSMQPVLTITAKDIERYGVTSLGELFRYIPQVSSFEQGQMVSNVSLLGTPTAGVTANRITATLRGAPSGGTLLLINGRRVAKTGQASTDGYDIGGIPLSAVERVDVLLDGASAIYGADAVGGVINVILRRQYRGTEARAGYENTFDSDVSVKTLSLTHGFSLGKFSGMANASWEDANSMMWADRPFLRTFDRRFLGGIDLRSGTGGRGVIASVSGNLPGLSTNQVTIPAGSAGTNVTVANYAAAGPLPPPVDQGTFSRYSFPYERKNATANMQYDFGRALTLFAEARWGESHTASSSTPINGFSTLVPAGAPGNPFGVPVRVTKYFFDLPAPVTEITTVNQAYVAGVRGEFLRDWRYEGSAQQASSEPDLGRAGVGLSAARVAAAFASATPPNLLYDSTSGTSPNPPGTIEALTTPGISGEFSRTRTYDLQTDGPLFALPAGQARISVGTEYRDEYVDFPIAQASLNALAYGRNTTGFFAEMRVPLVSERQGWPLLNRLEASVAVRHDRYSDFPQATNPRYGLLYRPFKWLMLRGSTGEGYKVPTLVQLYQPSISALSFFSPGAFFDAARGGETISGGSTGMAYVLRGNPALRPERSKNTTAGAVLEMPFVEGLSLSLDYYDTEYLDRVGSLSLTDRILLFPQTVIRGPNRPGDLPGWLGPVISYEDVSLNIAVNHLAGYDLGVKYHRPTSLGNWTFQAVASKTTRNETRSAPTQPVLQLPTFNQPLQIVGSMFWERDAFSTGALCSYREATLGSAATGPIIPSATRWDWQGSYRFDTRGWLADTRINVTIFNVFNRDPPLRAGVLIPDNTTVDSRLRRYSFNLIKEF